jgi:hypothetical protein
MHFVKNVAAALEEAFKLERGIFALAEWGKSWEEYHIVFVCDNSTIVGAINKKSLHGDAIEPPQLIFLTASLHDIEINCCWLASKDSRIAGTLSRSNLKRLAKFKLDKLPCEPGAPMSNLRHKLRIFFSTDSPLPQEQPTTQHETTMRSLPPYTAIHPPPSPSSPWWAGS